MLDSPFVSIIIPVFNLAPELPHAIDSALSQTYRRREVIVVDDGSTDGSAAIAESYGDSIVLIRQQNAGLAAARNAGISAGRGALIGLLDADDRWLPDKLSVEVPLFVDDSVGVVHGSYRRCPEIHPYAGQVNKINGRKTTFHELLGFNHVGAPVSAIFRRSVYDRVGGFREGMRGVEDWDLWIRMALCADVIASAPVTAEYQLRDDSMSRDYDVMYSSLLTAIRKNASHHGDCAECRQAVRRARAHARSFYFSRSALHAAQAKERGHYLQYLALRARGVIRHPQSVRRIAPSLARQVRELLWS